MNKFVEKLTHNGYILHSPFSYFYLAEVRKEN